MADITTFVPIETALWSGDNIIQLTATTAIKAGQVACINATGVSGAIDPGVGTGGVPIGVALMAAGAGTKATIATAGCVVYVNNCSDSTDIDAGDLLVSDDAAGLGMVAAVGTATTPQLVLGFAIDDIAASSSGRVLITPGCYTYHA